MIRSVGEFYQNIELHFGAPRLPEEASLDTFMEDFKADIGGFDNYVYDLAAQKLRRDPEAKQSFPKIGRILAACNEAERDIERSKPRQASDGGDPKWSKDRIDLANKLMDCDLGRQAAAEGWIGHFWDWCRIEGRWPNRFEAPKVRSDGFAIKVEREKMAEDPRSSYLIVRSATRAIEAKHKRLAELANRSSGSAA